MLMHRHKYLWTWLIGLFCIAVSLVISRPDAVPSVDVSPPNAGTRLPNSIPLIPHRLIEIRPSDLHEIRNRIVPPVAATGSSHYLHVLRLHGLRASFEHPRLKTSGDILTLLCNADQAKEYLGAPVAVKTRNGIALIGGGESLQAQSLTGEAHRDQILGAFGEYGVPLTQIVFVDGVQYSLEDVLDDVIANFHMGQQELQWTGLALAYYLAPQKEWTNKFGETFSFDGLATALMDAPLTRTSCAGTHLLQTLTAIYRVDTECESILSPEVRKKVHSRIAECVTAAVRTQAPDGSWSLDWCRDLLPSDEQPDSRNDSMSKMLATGHLGEWLLYVPGEFQVPEETLKLAGLWLAPRLLGMKQDEIDAAICPCTHAACVVQALARDGPGTFIREDRQSVLGDG
jgi:hypothetical protein